MTVITDNTGGPSPTEQTQTHKHNKDQKHAESTDLTEQLESRLLELPAELRLEIYELALTDHERIISPYDHSKGNATLHPGLGILLASQQTYREALPIYDATTRFIPSYVWNTLTNIRLFRYEIGPERSRLVSCIGYAWAMDFGRFMNSPYFLREASWQARRAHQALKDFQELKTTGFKSDAIQVKLCIYGIDDVAWCG